MPYSLVLNLIPKTDIPKSHLNGRNLHALFLDLVSSVDRELGNNLHQQTGKKAFTLSSLQVTSHNQKNLQFQPDRLIRAGTLCWWRISLLDDALFGQLMHLWLSLSSSKVWRLGGTDLQMVSVLGTPQVNQPWANFSTYSQIYELASDSDRQIKLEFCTPTTFRLTKYDCPLPSKELIFQSLLRRWNEYSGMAFDESLIEPIFPSYFDIRSEIVMDGRSKLIGCVGAIAFQILGEVDPIMIKQINALVDFAIYAGVGRKTTMGMGMVKRNL
jgi:CRISPR-associated endoribonuclease Cas6